MRGWEGRWDGRVEVLYGERRDEQRRGDEVRETEVSKIGSVGVRANVHAYRQ